MAANNLAYQYKTANIIIKIIAINAIIFIVVGLAAFLFDSSQAAITSWFSLPEDLGQLILQPWSLITYSFLHFGFFHILFNMLWLHFFGKFILTLFSEKRFLTVYLLGAFFGGLLFVVSYNVFPAFINSRSFLIGASGAVTAIMVFIATYTPNTAFRIFSWTIKLWQIAAVLFILDLVRLPSSGNAGGLLAHVGGGLFGYVYATQLAKGKDIGLWFEKIIDWVENLLKPRSKKPFKTVHRTKKTTTTRTSKTTGKNDHQKKIDAILDKIGKSGYDSLTKTEKDFLFKAGKEE
ncbi:rhomboid family intramembrane serine protease [Cochleicola gelatinilyticus]|uniref:Rhomboid family intramembrane serine protease n=1 Tax=Cochleicola gelatinilyticus TaxID=1763537 RepID=A0A167K7V4_9FLAO|nr:rhomboid family intramembrane serine protease [Cochleicola gelatinilyticus]OAB81478.1 rhomboid family intramembrane serine protease [Cochleicola gelatinilyticus]